MIEFKYNKVTAAGCFTGICSLFLPFYTLKSNRISDGDPVYLFKNSHYIFLVFVILWAAVFFSASMRFTFKNNKQSHSPEIGPALSGVLSIFLMIIVLVITGVFSHRLIMDGDRLSRLSPNAGFYFFLLGSYITADILKKKIYFTEIFSDFPSL